MEFGARGQRNKVANSEFTSLDATVVILAGGFGTRFSEETVARPKPMIEVAGKPILYHIMKQYSIFGLKKFIILTGYKDQIIKDYFLNFAAYNSNFQVSTKSGVIALDSEVEDWDVTILYTGLESQTGQRLMLAKELLIDEKYFFLTYGDGLANLNHYEAFKFHMAQKALITVTAVNPPGRFGSIQSENGIVKHWDEKRIGSEGLVSGGFFIVDPKLFNFVGPEDKILELDILPKLVRMGKLSSFEHFGFWQCMDTQRDREKLESYCVGQLPPWLKVV